jgi:hypothetical protein
LALQALHRLSALLSLQPKRQDWQAPLQRQVRLLRWVEERSRQVVEEWWLA